MYRGKTVGVIVPAYNEEKLIGKVLKTIPAFVDHIIVVDDASPDRTGEVVKEHQEGDSRIVYLRLKRNEGVGGAIVAGYKWARDHEIEISVVMAGDAQMDPDDLPICWTPLSRVRPIIPKGIASSQERPGGSSPKPVILEMPFFPF